MESQKKYNPVRLFYEVCLPHLHDPQLSPIILLHGTGALHSSWNTVITQIADKTRRKVFALDLRNHGQSEWSEHNTLHDHEADIKNFLLENGIKKCILIGHSLGGRVAMFLALKKPHIVDMIVAEEMQLSNPVSDDIADVMQLVVSAKKINMLPKGLDEVVVRNIISRLIANKYPSQYGVAYSTPLKKNCDGSYVFDFNIDVILKSYQNRTGYFIDFKECQKFTGPVLMMYAADSLLMKVEQDEKIKEFLPNAQLCKFETDAHVLHVNKPDEFLKKVLDFINK